MPSRWSGVPNSDRNTAAPQRTPSASVVSNARLTATFAIATATGDSAAMRVGDLQRLGDQLVRRNDAADQVAAFRLGRVHHPPGQDHVHRL